MSHVAMAFVAIVGSVQLANAQSSSASDNRWIRCATENGYCKVNSQTNVRFGIPGRWTYQTVSQGIACTNEAFGRDPASGLGKICEAQASPIAKSPPPNPISAQKQSPSNASPKLGQIVQQIYAIAQQAEAEKCSQGKNGYGAPIVRVLSSASSAEYQQISKQVDEVDERLNKACGITAAQTPPTTKMSQSDGVKVIVKLLLEKEHLADYTQQMNSLLSQFGGTEDLKHIFLSRALRSIVNDFPDFNDRLDVSLHVQAMFAILHDDRLFNIPAQVINQCEVQQSLQGLMRGGDPAFCDKYVRCHNVAFDALRGMMTAEVSFADSKFCFAPRTKSPTDNTAIINAIKLLDIERLNRRYAAIAPSDYQAFLDDRSIRLSGTSVAELDYSNANAVSASLVHIVAYIESLATPQATSVAEYCTTALQDVKDYVQVGGYSKAVGFSFWKSCMAAARAMGIN